MSQQAINTAYDSTQPKTSGELVVGLRVDSLPTGEARRLAAEGKWYPLTTDQDGNLRVSLPSTTKIEISELSIFSRLEDLLSEIRDLLLKIA